MLWGGREGYETLLNTDMKRELDQLGRFLSMVVDYKHKIGFQGTILIEPKPQEPTKHQYDYDVATVFGFLQRFGLEKEVKVNIETGHAVLAGHSFEHEIATARRARHLRLASTPTATTTSPAGTPTSSRTTSPRPRWRIYYILQGGGFTTGGFNFDAKLRRQSLDPEDLIAAHVGGMDVCARGLLAAAAMIEDGGLAAALAERYAGWDAPEAQAMLTQPTSRPSPPRVDRDGLDPQPRSGRQERLENWVNRFV